MATDPIRTTRPYRLPRHPGRLDRPSGQAGEPDRCPFRPPTVYRWPPTTLPTFITRRGGLRPRRPERSRDPGHGPDLPAGGRRLPLRSNSSNRAGRRVGAVVALHEAGCRTAALERPVNRNRRPHGFSLRGGSATSRRGIWTFLARSRRDDRDLRRKISAEKGASQDFLLGPLMKPIFARTNRWAMPMREVPSAFRSPDARHDARRPDRNPAPARPTFPHTSPPAGVSALLRRPRCRHKVVVAVRRRAYRGPRLRSPPRAQPRLVSL